MRTWSAGSCRADLFEVDLFGADPFAADPFAVDPFDPADHVRRAARKVAIGDRSTALGE
ncbi:hypothetical protein AB4305_25635 [Nocardia sp. 2YAB30]|uniref:hypothetical protein n=1 Tax=unclassified Nocardia TaxID=2637762 RepID=UPI003F9DE3D6